MKSYCRVILSEVSLTTWQLVALVGMIPEWGEESKEGGGGIPLIAAPAKVGVQGP